MIHNCKVKEISIIKFGRLDSTNANKVIRKANEYQKAFNFNFLRNIELPELDKYILKNESYDTTNFLKDFVKIKKHKSISKPIIFLTDDPIGEKEHQNELNYFFFLNREDYLDTEMAFISTTPLKYLSKNITYSDYLLMMFSTFLFSTFLSLNFHDDTRGCFLDFCDELSDVEKAFHLGELCNECEQEIQKNFLSNEFSIEQLSSAKRLMNKAVKRKTCFVAMPINEQFIDIYKTIKKTLSDISWTVTRADEVIFPRLITKRILLEILTADLIIADLTNSNPNVFFELGIAHLVGHDILMINQDDFIPFDIKNEQIIFYKKDNLIVLENSLKNFIKK